MSTTKPRLNRYIATSKQVKIFLSLLVVGTCGYAVCANKIFEMARYNDKNDIKKEWLEGFSESLKRIAAMIDANTTFMGEHNVDSVAATHFKTAEEAREGLIKFCGAIQAGLAEDSFRPLEPEPQKKKEPKSQKGQSDLKRK